MGSSDRVGPYRLNVFPVAVPPLRQRLDDIPALVDCFISRHAPWMGKRISGLEKGAFDVLQSHSWPGNVRELENTIERALVLTAGNTIPVDAITVESSVRPHTSEFLPSLRLRDNVKRVESETIRQALHMSSTKQQAATLLGISPRALSYYLAKHRLLDAAQHTSRP